MDEILFQITKDQLETGLRGVPVGYCTTSYVDPQQGLFYIDRPVSDMVSWTPLQTLYLLYFGEEGSNADLERFAKELQKRACCPDAVIQAIEALPREGHPMKLYAAAVLILGMFEATGDYEKDALNLIAKLPHLTAAVINHHAGWGKTGVPDPQHGYMESFAHLLKSSSEKAPLIRALNLFYILHLDHGGGNLSTFVGKAVASGLEDLYGSIASALSALAGPRHGKASQDCLSFVHEVLSELGPQSSGAEVEALIRRRLQNKQLVFGFGHAVLRVEDPRATVQYAFLNRHYPHEPLVHIVNLLRTVGPKVLSENPKIANPYPNLDAVSGTLLSVSGFPHPDYYTLLFGLARSAGISIQIIYERCEAREGKGTPIIRPKYLFKKRN
jgi:citrate synthase